MTRRPDMTVLWWSVFLCFISAFLLLAREADAADCPPPSVCTTGEAINAAADGLCRRARTAESRLGDPEQPAAGTVLYQLGQEQKSHQRCQGQLLYLEQNPPTVTRAPLWLRLVLDVGVGVTAASTGTVAALGAPSEVVVGLAVASVGVLVSRLVLEVVW